MKSFLAQRKAFSSDFCHDMTVATFADGKQIKTACDSLSLVAVSEKTFFLSSIFYVAHAEEVMFKT